MKILYLLANSNSPFVHEMNILEETEKAYRVENIYKTYSCWLPKKALQIVDNDKFMQTYTFKNWFRQLDNGMAINKVFRLFN